MADMHDFKVLWAKPSSVNCDTWKHNTSSETGSGVSLLALHFLSGFWPSYVFFWSTVLNPVDSISDHSCPVYWGPIWFLSDKEIDDLTGNGMREWGCLKATLRRMWSCGFFPAVDRSIIPLTKVRSGRIALAACCSVLIRDMSLMSLFSGRVFTVPPFYHTFTETLKLFEG